jgi:hypothetical protein
MLISDTMRPAVCGHVVVAGLLLHVAAAFAAPKTGALLPTLRPAAPNELRDRMHDAITRGMSAAGMDTVQGAEVRMRLALSEEQLNCAAPGPCAARAAMNLRVDRLVATEVIIAGKDYTIRMKLLDQAGREVGKVEEACDICTVKEADEAVARAATKLINNNRAAITESAPPPPAPAPPKPEPLPTQPKPQPSEPTPAPVAQPTPTPAATTTEPAKPADKKPIPWRWLAVGMLGVGVVGLAVGIPLLAIDGNPTCTPPPGQDPKKVCKELYDTAAGGGVMLAVGLASLATSGAFWYLDHRQRKQANAPKVTAFDVFPLREGGAVVSVGGRF